jgi:hypothetical protein
MAERQDPTPEGERPITADERMRAQRLGRLVDAMLSGQGAPPALEAEERALLEAATIVHATLGHPGLAHARMQVVIDSALGEATQQAPERPGIPDRAATPLPVRAKRRASRTKAYVAGAALGLVAAAVIMVKLRPEGQSLRARLRSPDAVLGRPIARAEAPAATARVDALLADRRDSTVEEP